MGFTFPFCSSRRGTGSTQQTPAESTRVPACSWPLPTPKAVSEVAPSLLEEEQSYKSQSQATEADSFLWTRLCWGGSCCLPSLSQTQLLLYLSCQSQVSTHRKTTMTSVAEKAKHSSVRELYSKFSCRKASCKTKVMDMVKQPIKQLCVQVTHLLWPCLTPFSVLSNLNLDFENKGQDCSYFPAQPPPQP